MKTYENLTKLEREKLATYQRYCIIENMQLLAFSMLGLLVMLAGICMFMLFTSVIVVIVGMYLVLIGLICTAMPVLSSRKSKKELFLIFGYKDSIKDLFEVKLTDIKDVIIEHRTIWRKK